MSTHSITSMLGMTRDRFGFIWRHFHVQSDTATYQKENLDTDDDTEEVEEREEYIVEQCLERAQAEEEKRYRDDSSMDSDGSDEEDNDIDSSGTKGKANKGGDSDGEKEIIQGK
eukprot:6116899-Ditylum_brightwellii.AAC.1